MMIAMMVLASALTVADRAASGEVEVVGIPWSFPSNRIDWLFNPTERKGPFNPEWTWQLNRMYFWKDMAEAYRTTKDEKYARAFAMQLGDWLDQTGGVPAEEGYNGCGSPWRTIEEGLRLMDAWPIAYDAFAASPSFAPKLKERFVASMRAQANHLVKHRSAGSNWLLIEMTGIYSFACRFPDFPESGTLRRTAAGTVCRALKEQQLPDGMHDELSSDYFVVFYMTAERVYRLARQHGYVAELPRDFGDMLERGAEATLDMMLPGFVQPSFNDSWNTPSHEVLGRASDLFPNRRDFLWGATEGRKGKPPAGGRTASRFLPYAGFAAMRTDWSRNASCLVFDVGPLGQAHAHQDKLGFALWKGDEQLVFDDGGGQYDDSAQRRYALTAYDHNTLLVDGLAQRRKGPLKVAAPIEAGWKTTAAGDVAYGVYDQGFGDSMLKLAVQKRTVAFDRRKDVFTVTDEVRSADGNAHVYELLFHVDSTNVAVSADATVATVDYGAGRRWKLELKAGGGTITTASGQLNPRLSGWYVGRIGTKASYRVATTISVKAAKAVPDHTFVTTLKPVRRK